MSGTAYNQCGAGGTLASHASSDSRIALTSSAPCGAARPRGNTTTRATSSTMNRAMVGLGSRKLRSSQTKTGQVAKTRMAAQSRAEKNG